MKLPPLHEGVRLGAGEWTRRNGSEEDIEVLDACELPRLSRLAVNDVVEIDFHHQQFRNGSSVRSHRERSSARRKFYSICFDIVGCKLRSCNVAGDFYIIVVPSQQPVGSKIESLQWTVTSQSTRQVSAENPSNLVAFVLRLFFFDLQPFHFNKMAC
jgi:hypothetical protein